MRFDSQSFRVLLLLRRFRLPLPSPAVSVLVAVLLTNLAMRRWGCSAEEVMPWRGVRERFGHRAGEL